MARVGPKNIHVAHLIIDPASTLNGCGSPSGARSNALDNPDLLMPPASVAASTGNSTATEGAWTFELEIRPVRQKYRAGPMVAYPDDVAFRDEVRAFIKTIIRRRCASPTRRPISKGADAVVASHPHTRLDRCSGRRNMAGRAGRSPAASSSSRRRRAGTMPPLAFSVTMVGPVIYTFGNAAQKAKFLPRIFRRDWWCQGYSSRAQAPIRHRPHQGGARRRPPSSTATRPGPRWPMPTGFSAWCGPMPAKPQSGISFLLIDMKPPSHRCQSSPSMARTRSTTSS